jgi:hypothetical protein
VQKRILFESQICQTRSIDHDKAKKTLNSHFTETLEHFVMGFKLHGKN